MAARDVRETARKLRRLTASPNAHEAARARERLAAYMAKHRLQPADLVEPTTFDAELAATLAYLADLARQAVAPDERRKWREMREYIAALGRSRRART